MPLPRLFGIPCWLFPVLAGSSWFITLISMLMTWVAKGSPHFPEMHSDQHLAYISNIGACEWGQPLFITGSAITTGLFGITFGIERWLRHENRLIHSSSSSATRLSIAAGFFTLTGTCGLNLMTFYTIRLYPLVHFPMLAVFVLGYVTAAGFISAEKRLLIKAFPNTQILRQAYWIKLSFVSTEVALLLVFGFSCLNQQWVISVVFEWIVGLLFSFYMGSFAIDFMSVPEEEGSDEKGYLIGLRSPSIWDSEAASIKTPSSVYTNFSRVTYKSYI